jgi:DNA-binding SARP family transcriptional activator
VGDRAQLRLFGEFSLEDPEGRPIILNLRKAEALIAYLALAPGQSSSRERLAALLWGDSDQGRARQSLRQAIFALTKAFAQRDLSLLRLESQAVRLAENAMSVDAVEFDGLIADGSKAALVRANELYVGELLSGFSVEEPEFEQWLSAKRGVYQDTALRALIELLQEQEKAGELDLAIETANKALRIDLFREDIHRQLMRVYAAKGMRSSALSQYRSCRDVLERELGVRPDDDTTKLYRTILEQGGDDWHPNEGDQLGQAGIGPADHSGPQIQRRAAASHGVHVGRESEIRQLISLTETVRTEGCRFALLTGEAGVGKTHLLDRFAFESANNGIAVSMTRAYKTNEKQPLGLWSGSTTDILPDWKTLRRDLPAPLSSEIERLFEPPTEASGSNGLGIATGGLSQAIGEALRRRAGDRGLVVFCDDLHWADDDSLRLLFQLVRQLGRAPVLFVCAASSDGLRRRAGLRDLVEDLDRGGRLNSIRLAPLSREESVELAWKLQQALEVKRDSKSRLLRIWQFSEGNPRMIRESVLAIANDDSLGQGIEAPLPRALLDEVALVQSRLGPSAREMMAFAAMMGDRIDYPVLIRAMGVDEDLAARAMEELVAENVISASGDAAAFVHKRVALAARQDLLPPRRRLIHGALARAIEGIHDGALERHYLTLAGHHHEAGDREKGLSYDLLAARVEVNRGLPSSARRLFQRVLDTARKLERSDQVAGSEIDAHLGLAALAEAEGDRKRALACLDSAAALSSRQGSDSQAALLHMTRARLLYVAGGTERAYALARQALGAVDHYDPSLLWLPGEYLLGHLHLVGGSIVRVIERMTRRYGRCMDLGLKEDAADAAAILGLLHGIRGQFGDAGQWCADAVRIAESIANEAYMASCLQAKGTVGCWCGDVQPALEEFDRALDIARARGDVLRLYSLTGHKANALLLAGQTREAIALLEKAIAWGERLGAGLFQPLFKAWLAEASVGEFSDEEVLRLARESLRQAADRNQAWARSVAHRALARLLSRPSSRDLSAADRAIRSAVAAQSSLGLPFEVARSLVVHAKILRARGNARRSSEIFAEAGEIFEKMGLTADFDRAKTMSDALRPPTGAAD